MLSNKADKCLPVTEARDCNPHEQQDIDEPRTEQDINFARRPIYAHASAAQIPDSSSENGQCKLSVPALTAVGIIGHPANFVAFRVWLSLFFALLMILLLPSSGSKSTLFSTTIKSLVANSPTTRHSAVYVPHASSACKRSRFVASTCTACYSSTHSILLNYIHYINHNQGVFTQ